MTRANRTLHTCVHLCALAHSSCYAEPHSCAAIRCHRYQLDSHSVRCSLVAPPFCCRCAPLICDDPTTQRISAIRSLDSIPDTGFCDRVHQSARPFCLSLGLVHVSAAITIATAITPSTYITASSNCTEYLSLSLSLSHIIYLPAAIPLALTLPAFLLARLYIVQLPNRILSRSSTHTLSNKKRRNKQVVSRPFVTRTLSLLAWLLLLLQHQALDLRDLGFALVTLGA